MDNVRFGVYKHHIVYKNGILIRKQMIVLKDEDDCVLAWTDYHRYARGSKKKRLRSIDAGQDKRCCYVTKLLNYVFFQKYTIKRLIDIEPSMVKEFLNDYGLCRLPDDDEKTHRTKETVEICICAIMDFLDLLIEDNPSCKIRTNDLYRTEEVFDRRTKKTVKKKIPLFEINCNSEGGKIFRDIPEGAFKIFMDEIVLNHKKILMLAAGSAFAGMRPSECCNMRREDSPLGRGIYFEVVDGEVINIKIDLEHELNLRSDMVNVGGIKKHRPQKVYPAFIGAFLDCYNVYMRYIEGKPYEAEYGALTNTSFGKAYTYADYRYEFSKVVKACIPIMLASDDPKTVNYGHMLLENKIGPHVFRHWFSVKLTLYGEGIHELKTWRGDKSPESAQVYLSHKSDLEKEYKLVNNEAFNYLQWRASKIIEEDNNGKNDNDKS